jgi:predicted short-subunit dehydrogenase-like oxidoreductase (DUF2520 family)
MQKSLAILGAGRVGRALARALHDHGWHIGVVTARTEASAHKATKFIRAGRAFDHIPAQVAAAKVVLISVPDDAIPETALQLARVGGGQLKRTVVLHTSGACDASALRAVRECGALTGSMHPLQTFNGLSVPPLEGKVFGIEGDPPAVRVARAIARSLGGVPVNIRRENKVAYHAAGAFASGLLLSLEEAGVQILQNAGLPRREALRALLSLSRQVLAHYEKLGPHKAWTGPLSRGDFGVVAAHARAISRLHPEFLEAYQSVSRLSAHVLASDPAEMLQKLESTTPHPTTTAKSKGGMA